ncbi:MAG: hypothetical protein ACE5F9_01130 [Phycisphaerae bacterium]
MPPTPATRPVQDATATATHPVDAARRRRLAVTISIVLALAGGYVLYERIGTTANVEVVETYQRFAGGFLAVGHTDSEPGILVLSRLEDRIVRIDATLHRNWATGTSTRVAVSTPEATWRHRLRGPEVVMIDADGSIQTTGVDWSAEDFTSISRAVNCDDATAPHEGCGRPFHDFQQWLSAGSHAVPDAIHQFLARPDREP